MELTGWLEPLLDRIARNSTNVVTPIIDVINDTTFQYHHGPGIAVGGFDWDLQVASCSILIPLPLEPLNTDLDLIFLSFNIIFFRLFLEYFAHFSLSNDRNSSLVPFYTIFQFNSIQCYTILHCSIQLTQQFNWHGIPDHEKKRRSHTSDPAYSPTMAGGLFSIDKAFFEKLGTYDDGFDIWGGENLELSFKVLDIAFALLLVS